jgi:PncC family amidohydrolase
MVEKKMLDALAEQLVSKHQTVAVAESVTAGLLMTTLSRAEKATQFLQGGVVAYNLGQKARHLSVNPIHADAANCVSAEVSEQMAQGVAQTFSGDWGIGITGYAVPVPALHITTCFAFYAIVLHGNVIKIGRIESTKDGQGAVQEDFVKLLVAGFLDTLRSR